MRRGQRAGRTRRRRRPEIHLEIFGNRGPEVAQFAGRPVIQLRVLREIEPTGARKEAQIVRHAALFLLGQAGLPQERSFTHHVGHIAASELAKNSAKLPGPMQNPLLDLTFPVPFDAIREEHIEPAVRTRLADAHAAIDAIAASTGPFSYESTLGALEQASEQLELVMSLVEHLESVSTTPALREAYNAVLPDVSAFGSSIPLNPGLWRALSEFEKTPEARALDPIRRRLLDNTLADFRRSGAQLEDEKKERLKAIDSELSLITTRFSQNVLDSTNEFEILIEDEAALLGLPESAKAAARDSAQQKDKSGYRFTLQAPSMMAVLTYSADEALRERVWRAQSTVATEGKHDNRAIVARILELRKEKANLLGFRDFADFQLD